MRGIQIVGYKKSGKTTLAEALIKDLEQSGSTVSVLKFSHHGFDQPQTDTARLAAPGRVVAGIAESQSAIFWNGKRWFADMLPLLRADMLVVEGGKALGSMPRIICLEHLESLEALKPHLAVASFGPQKHDLLLNVPHFYPNDLQNPQKLAELSSLITHRAFLLPGLDCATCGLPDCEGLAALIVQGKSQVDACRALNTNISITVNGQPIALNPFTANIIAGSIKGMIGALKGVAPGAVEIKILEG